jgi:predicted neuraminidase
VLTEEIGFLCRQPGLILSNGEWLLPIYDNRGGARPEYAGMGGNEGSVVISNDGGRCWRRYGRMVADAGTAQPTVVELEPGHLRAWLRTRNFWNGENPAWAFIYRAESADHGRNWTRPQPTMLPNNNSSIQVRRLQSSALALVYNHQSGRIRSPLNIALSYDDGETWPVRRELEPFSPEGFEFSYPAIAQTPDGTIHVAYTWKRTHMKHVAIDQEWIEAI